MSLELLYFWRECRDRRRQQLDKHIATFNGMADKFQKNLFPSEEKKKENEQLNPLLREQSEWIRDAEKKLEHAEAMVKFFEGGFSGEG